MTLNPIVNSENGRFDIFSLNLDNRIVLLTGEIDDEMSSSVTSQLLYLDNSDTDPIDLYINSPGGSVSAGLAIYDVIHNLKSPVNTICMGKAASMAAVLLSGGTGKRMILPHSEVMIHQPSGGVDGQATDILIAASHIESLKGVLNGLLCRNCGKTPEEIADATERDHWMNAEEAKEYGIVDEIIGLQH